MRRRRSHSDVMDEMTLVNGRGTQTNQSSGGKPWYLLAVGALVLLLVIAHQSSKEQKDSMTIKKDSSSVTILKGEIQGLDQSTIPYYLCNGSGDLDMVLLHGASFTKENWKTSGLLQKLSVLPQVSTVIALDLSHRSKHDGLKEALNSLREKQIISSTNPIALVTPSASGEAMIDWASADTTKDADDIAKYIKYWIPVASPAISRAEPEWLERMKNLNILAVYGSKDAGGKQVSLRLEEYSTAKVVEITGRHPCYLDSPDDFVTVVNEFLH